MLFQKTEMVRVSSKYFSVGTKALKGVARFFVITLPHLMVWTALAILAYSSIQEFGKGGDFQTLLPMFASIIAIVIALASVTFAYAKAVEGDEEYHGLIVSAGEMFFYSAIIIIMVLLISWFTFKVDSLVSQFDWYSYVKISLGIIFGIPYFFLTYAANSLSKAIKILELNLWVRLKDQIGEPFK